MSNKTISNRTKKFDLPVSKDAKPVKVEVRDINTQGLVTLRYSHKIMNTSVINDTILDISVRMNEESKGNKTILSWNVTAVSDREHQIQLIFAEPGDISNDLVRNPAFFKCDIGQRLARDKVHSE